MAALVDRPATYLAPVVGHLKTQIALGAAEAVPFSVPFDNPERFTADPDMEAEQFVFSCHFLLSLDDDVLDIEMEFAAQPRNLWMTVRILTEGEEDHAVPGVTTHSMAA